MRMRMLITFFSRRPPKEVLGRPCAQPMDPFPQSASLVTDTVMECDPANSADGLRPGPTVFSASNLRTFLVREFSQNLKSAHGTDR